MLKCSNCGSTDVEIRGWQSQQDGTFYPMEDSKIDDNWCNDCQMHTELVEKSGADYILGDYTICTPNSNPVKIYTFDEELLHEKGFEYSIINRKEFIDDLYTWIGEAIRAGNSDAVLMKQDLEMLIKIEDEWIFSSTSTNKYIYEGHSEFNKTCKELIELSKLLSDDD